MKKPLAAFGVKIKTLSKLFRTKPLEQCLEDAEKLEYQMKRVLGPFQLILFGIGAIIGAGIFATIGTASAGDSFRPGAGPALMVSFVIMAIVCSFTALSYAEFTSIVPISGSAYTYSYATLGIMSCLYLIYYLPPTSWLRFAAWLNFGFLIYVGYGAIHSRMMGHEMHKRGPEYLAYTARLGTVLLVIGDAMLFLMRGFDVYRVAHKSTIGFPSWDRFTAALHQTFHAGPWTEKSWFLIIPLILNAVILCPLIIQRSSQANSLGETDRRSRASSLIATVIAILSLIYLVIVFF